MTITMRFLDRFKVVLLDMNGTFMFCQDRFGPSENFATTYRGVGGNMLTDVEVERAVTFECVAKSFKVETYRESMKTVLGRVVQRLISCPDDAQT